MFIGVLLIYYTANVVLFSEQTTLSLDFFQNIFAWWYYLVCIYGLLPYYI